MRILLVVPTDEDLGGVPYVVGNLARYLQGKGHEVIFLFPGKSIFLKPKVTKWGYPGFELRMQLPFGERHPIVSLTVFLLLFPVIMCQLIRLLQRCRIQIVNVHYPADPFFYFSICRHILRVKLITSVHGADILPDGKPRDQYSQAMKSLLSSSDRIIAVSRAFQNDFVNLFPNFQGKSIYIHNGVNRTELNQSLKFESRHDQDRYILCVAMHNEKKALDVLIRAVALLDDVKPPFKLILVGDGPLHQHLKDLALSLKVHKRIAFLGFQGRTEVVKLLHGCELFVLPSRSEPFGIAIIEALACKKPVVATSVGGIPEIIEHGINGILVDPDNPSALAEALRTLLTDNDLRRTLAANGYVTVQRRFCYENTGAAYEAVFFDLLGSPRSTSA
jgi:glycosyltransferase involved in cell wall biosynthesis